MVRGLLHPCRPPPPPWLPRTHVQHKRQTRGLLGQVLLEICRASPWAPTGTEGSILNSDPAHTHPPTHRDPLRIMVETPALPPKPTLSPC